MSDNLMYIIAGMVLFFTILPIIALPFSIGKDRGIYTAGAYIFRLLYSVLIVILIGRIFGWW